MKATNIAIIGAGPAGSSAAFFLASTGMKVILIDKASFPREKICGDAVTRDGLQVLERAGLQNWASQFPSIDSLRFTSPDETVLDVNLKDHKDGCAGRLIPRIQLDNQLLNSAIQAGAKFIGQTRVKSVEVLTGEGVKINTSHEQIKAQMVILADGSNASVTRQMKLLRSKADLFAIRQYLECDIDPTGPLEFHFQNIVIPGYSWLFPMGNGQINIGAGTYSSRIKNKEVDLPSILESLKQNHPLYKDLLKKARVISPPKGQSLRTNVTETRLFADHVLVTGDAAGLVSPFTGEGIASAMRSGEAAAFHAFQAVIKGNFSARALEPYSNAIRSRYQHDQNAGRILRSILRYPSLLNHAFIRMKQDNQLAELFAQIYLDEKSPRLLLHPITLLKLFR